MPDQFIIANSIGDGSGLGVPQIQPGEVGIQVVQIFSEEAFGRPELVRGVSTRAFAVASASVTAVAAAPRALALVTPHRVGRRVTRQGAVIQGIPARERRRSLTRTASALSVSQATPEPTLRVSQPQVSGSMAVSDVSRGLVQSATAVFAPPISGGPARHTLGGEGA
jgi:hypothetical protein